MTFSRAQLPNLLTFARVAAVPLVLVIILVEPFAYRLLFWIFITASATDYLDGYLARRFNAVTPLGTLLDPIADKLLVALLLLYGQHYLNLPLVPIAAILLRELYISGLREFLAHRQITVPVSTNAKYKTLLQMAALALLLGGAGFGYAWVLTLGQVVLWLAAGVTLFTAYEYTRDSAPHLRKA